MSNRIFAILRSLRYKDVFIFEAPALVGLAFSIPGLTPATAAKTLLFFLACFLLMAQIFYFNDWSDSTSDSKVAEKIQEMHIKQGIPRQDMLVLSTVSGVASLCAFALFSNSLFIIALSILVLGVMYSFPHPRLKGKGIPLLSSGLHIAGAVLTFLLGYAAFSVIDPRGLLISGYFAFLLTAGHLIQEVQDHAGDQSTYISTNAVRFGPTVIFVSAFGLFTGSFAYLFGLANAGLIPSILKYLVLFFPIFGGLGIRAFRAGINYEEMQRFRSQYRILFGIIVCIMAGVTILYRL